MKTVIMLYLFITFSGSSLLVYELRQTDQTRECRNKEQWG